MTVQRSTRGHRLTLIERLSAVAIIGLLNRLLPRAVQSARRCLNFIDAPSHASGKALRSSAPPRSAAQEPLYSACISVRLAIMGSFLASAIPVPPRRRGLTLIELLAVIAIIGLLAGVLLPAVQSAREGARRTDCTNKIKQVSLALNQYHAANGSLPKSICNQQQLTPVQEEFAYTIAKPDMWTVEIMPYLNLTALRDAFDQTKEINIDTTSASKPISNRTLSRTQLSTYICPSDPFSANPFLENRCGVATGTTTGHGLWYAGSLGPIALRNASCGMCPVGMRSASRSSPCCNGTHGDPPGFFSNTTRRISFDSATDGVSNTILVGETLPNDSSHNGVYISNFMTVTTNAPLNRFATATEIPQPGDACGNVARNEHMNSGIKSRHSGGAAVAMADGGVKFLNETISAPLLWALGTRRGGEVDQVPAIVE